jgi:protein-S-isoprenylcysteine O-methyltransferase Ste14
MNWRLIRTIIVLPGNVVVFIPAAILWISGRLGYSPKFAAADQFLFWIALLAASIGLCLSIWTATLFVKVGKGTPAPWDPPKKLVIRGPYCYVRNPMILGVMFMLLAESLLFQSLSIAAWLVVFFIGNSIYFPLVEEKSLEKRFGDDYREYKARVRRWIPRLRPWTGP